jgi:hypothetical protein
LKNIIIFQFIKKKIMDAAYISESVVDRLEDFDFDLTKIGTAVKVVVFTDDNREIVQEILQDYLDIDDDTFERMYDAIQFIEDEIGLYSIQRVQAGETEFKPINISTPPIPEFNINLNTVEHASARPQEHTSARPQEYASAYSCGGVHKCTTTEPQEHASSPRNRCSGPEIASLPPQLQPPNAVRVAAQQFNTTYHDGTLSTI